MTMEYCWTEYHPRLTATVLALQIRSVLCNDDQSGSLMLAGGSVIRVSAEFMQRSEPQIGGYVIFLGERELEYMPAKLFEDRYVERS